MSKKKYKKVKHSDYLIYYIPADWSIYEDEDTVSIYNDNDDGVGVLTLSFYTFIEFESSINSLEFENSIIREMNEMAKQFVEKNNIVLDNYFILDVSNKNKKVLYATGKTVESDFLKLWIIAKKYKIILASYENEKKIEELKEVDKIIDSFYFTI